MYAYVHDILLIPHPPMPHPPPNPMCPSPPPPHMWLVGCGGALGVWGIRRTSCPSTPISIFFCHRNAVPKQGEKLNGRYHLLARQTYFSCSGRHHANWQCPFNFSPCLGTGLWWAHYLDTNHFILYLKAIISILVVY